MISSRASFLLVTAIAVFSLLAHEASGRKNSHNDELEKLRALESFVELKGGEFFMGINDRFGANGEYPPRKAIVQPFRIHLYPVTVASFKKYKNDKFRHQTEAEKIGSSWVFLPLVDAKAELDTNSGHNENDDPESIEARNMSMVRVHEARWNRPEGGESSIFHRLSEPVVHVSYDDAAAYCTWMHMRLPTEIEWEFAARGGLQEKLYPWGDKWEVGRSNLWQGRFPDENQKRDNFYGLSPVDAYKPQNNYEMYDLIGNVWEWTSTIYRETKTKGKETRADERERRALKGGSFMDNRDGENRSDRLKIRTSARMGRHRTYTAYNVGFRCVQSIQPGERGVDFSKSSFKVIKLRPPKKHVIRDEDEL